MQPRPRGPVLSRLEPLVGEWELEASIDGQPTVRGTTRFEWLEGGAFLVQHADAAPTPGAPPEWTENSPFPLTTVFGLDDASGLFTMLYTDARGVCRVYPMSLDDGVWTIWGQAGPGFFQRFTASFSDDGRRITGRWERSGDGESWELDFDMEYTKVVGGAP
jgi:hypothetical protein